MRENRKQKQKKNSSFADCLQSAKLGKKTQEESLPTATPKAVGKEHFKKKNFFLCRLPSWRPVGKQFLKKNSLPTAEEPAVGKGCRQG